MSFLESYSFLWYDSAFAALWFMFRQELVFPVMHRLGTYNPALVILVSALGSATGYVGNYLTGRIVRYYYADFITSRVKKWKLVTKLACVGQGLLLFAWFPLVGVLSTLVAGICAMRLTRYLCLVFLGSVLYNIMRFWYG